jgi:hypothetical protein
MKVLNLEEEIIRGIDLGDFPEIDEGFDPLRMKFL